VTVSEVFSIGETWLVIHKQNPDGNMGTFIGYTKVPDGLSRDVKVTVDPSLASPVLYAMLHEDREPIGELAFPGSDVPVMVDGKELTPSFNVLQAGKNDVIINASTSQVTFPHLSDGRGMSLYTSLDDQPGQRNCAGECLNNWKPMLATGRLVPGGGVNRAKLGVIILPDGSRQVTYSGLPLYTYVQDQNPGDINGQGLDGLWFLATP